MAAVGAGGIAVRRAALLARERGPAPVRQMKACREPSPSGFFRIGLFVTDFAIFPRIGYVNGGNAL